MLLALYLIAITAEAMTAALAAGRRDMDWIGVCIIACVTALGGGTLRDVVLGHYPVTWVLHPRSAEHTSELQSLMRSSYAVFCLNIKTRQLPPYHTTPL